jgi:hypothetical protein
MDQPSRMSRLNPFGRRESHSSEQVITYKVLTVVTWLLSIVTTLYYSFDDTRDGYHIRRRIWDQNELYHNTAFYMNNIIASVYWILLFAFQLSYLIQLFVGGIETVNAACNVGSHFILNNLLHFGWVMLFVRSHFHWSEVMLVLNFFNLTSLYFRHNTYNRFIHVPTVSGPLAWTFVAIYWNGAMMVPHPTSVVARIFGNIFIWSILAYGVFFLVFYKDYTMSFNLSILSAAIGVGQFFRQVVAFQWIFAFTIMAVLFVGSVPAMMAAFSRRGGVLADQERAPLLADN